MKSKKITIFLILLTIYVLLLLFIPLRRRRRGPSSLVCPGAHNIDKTEDFAPEREEVRAKLLPIARAAMNHKDPQTKKAPLVKLVVDKLYINNQRYTVDDLEQLPEHLKPARVYTPMNENRAVFFTKNSPLSNHYPSTFKHNSESFNCAEQFIMISKARLFGDQESVTQIMREKDPVKQKQLGKSIKNYDQSHWRARAPELITPGLVSKFEQNPVCKKVLLATQHRLIIEANKHDMYFGAGMSLRDPLILVEWLNVIFFPYRYRADKSPIFCI